MVKFIVSIALLVLAAHVDAVELLPGGPFIANYASSYNAHVVNHDVRVPVAPIQSALVQPVVGGYAQPAFASYAQPAVARFAQPAVATFSQSPVASFTQPAVAATYVQQPLARFVQPAVATYAQPEIARFAQPSVTTFSQPPIGRFAQPVVRDITPEVLPARLSLQPSNAPMQVVPVPQYQTREGPNPDAQRRSSEPERLQKQPNDKLNETPNSIPAPVLLGSRFLARNQAQPTPVPNGFVFSSRSVNAEGSQQESRGDQRNIQFRTAQFQIARNSAREQSQRSMLNDSEQKENNRNEIDGRQINRNAKLQNSDEAKPAASNGRPNIYSQVITF